MWPSKAKDQSKEKGWAALNEAPSCHLRRRHNRRSRCVFNRLLLHRWLLFTNKLALVVETYELVDMSVDSKAMVLLVLLLQLHSLQLLLSQLLLLLLDRLLLLIQWTCIHTSRASFFVIVAVSTKEYFP